MNNVHYQSIKYFLRLQTLNTETLLSKRYEEEKQMHQNGEICFITYITDILDKIGMSYIWMNQIDTITNKTTSKKHILTRLDDISSQLALDRMHNTNKLAFLSGIKGTFGMEKYL